MVRPPRIDSRTADDVVRQLIALLSNGGSDPDGRPVEIPAQDPGRALIEIFARFAELTIERLNQVPDKNLLAFLDLIGASLAPPQPARVPLTFSLVSGSTVDGIVPVRTQVAATPAEGEAAPVVFETEEELVVAAAQLDSVYVRRPDQNKYANLSALVNTVNTDGSPAFLGDRTFENILYVGDDRFLSDPGLTSLKLSFAIKPIKPKTSLQALQTIWERWDGTKWISLAGLSDPTNGLTSSGDVAFNLKPLQRSAIDGVYKCWLRCRLLTPIPPASFVLPDNLPELLPIVIKEVTFSGAQMGVEHAVANNTEVEIVKGFFPFGERPKIGDTMYLAHATVFGKAGAQVTLNLKISNQPKASNVVILWESWDGNSWATLVSNDKTSSLTAGGSVVVTLPAQPKLTTINGVESYWIRARITGGDYGKEQTYIQDSTTKEYKIVAATYAPPFISSMSLDYTVTYPLPASPPAAALTPEVVKTWNDFQYATVTDKASFFPFKPVADLKPTLYFGFVLPGQIDSFSNRKISFYVALEQFRFGENLIPLSPGNSRQETVDAKPTTVAHNFVVTNTSANSVTCACSAQGNLWSVSVDDTLTIPARSSKELIARVTIPPQQQIGASDQGFVTITFDSAPGVEYSSTLVTYLGPAPSLKDPQFVWQYSNGDSWTNLLVRDSTGDLSQSGIVEFLAPADFGQGSQFGVQRYWLRAIWQGGQYSFEPRLRGVLPNTVMAVQAQTITDEVLGSSSGTEGQIFRTVHAPVVAGAQLYVREPGLPAASERTTVIRSSDLDNVSGSQTDVWILWQQTSDFYASSARDRHYVLDSLTGEIQFGDGRNGLVPPAGTGNLRMSVYQAGGGASGNKAAGVITQLKTTVPFVQQVVNYLPASGGTDAETTSALLNRAPRSLRHNFRAVTVKDYEDLALLASTEVARAKCVPLTNLITNQKNADSRLIQNGSVSLIIVPRSQEPKASPSIELVARVQEFIESHHNPIASLIVVGPKYLAINVTVDVSPVSLDGAAELKLLITQTIAAYLHPLTGGRDGSGWDFGRYPHESNLYTLIEALPGVDYVKTLEFDPTTADDVVKKAGNYFLVFSGTHTVNLMF